MESIRYQPLLPNDESLLQLVAGWYRSEWSMAPEATLNKLRGIQPPELHQVQLLDSVPVATGGVHRHVSLLDHFPHLRGYPHWLALVYTVPEHRGRGLGAQLCRHMEALAKAQGLEQLHLFTHTAESLYRRLGWTEVERISARGKDIVVMRKVL